MAVALFLVPMADNVASRATTSACETFHLIRPIVTRPPGGVLGDDLLHLINS